MSDQHSTGHGPIWTEQSVQDILPELRRAFAECGITHYDEDAAMKVVTSGIRFDEMMRAYWQR
jgi:hypothetical protein